MAEVFWQIVSLLDQTIGKIVVTLLAGGIVAVGGYILKRNQVQAAVDSVRLRLLRHSASKNDLEYAKIRKKLLESLRNDQSTSGPHYGQFGKLWSLEEEARYQTGFEDIRAKPRMYLTLWPSAILQREAICVYTYKGLCKESSA